ncbi:MAG: hypothetical protein BECKG1743D_GA0114223_109712 [Candidatus Kentron sp. G]|nr:MAG: hypothetical protein BECKG1743D_GA0114223_109712 [Candidatus Kentron sp. G]
MGEKDKQAGMFFDRNHLMSCMQKSSCTPNIVKNSLKMLIYFHVNSAFSLVFASLWDTI